jgi:GTPase involved in cell partitioning and DNA repair
LQTYDPSLLDKSIWLAINKKDTLDEEKQNQLIDLIKNNMSSLKLHHEGVIAISGFTGDKTEELLGMIAKKMSESDN